MAKPVIVGRLVDRLRAAIAGQSKDAIDAEIENTARTVVQALVHRKPEITMAVYPAVEKMYSDLRVAGGNSPAEAEVLGQLRTLTTMCFVASELNRGSVDLARFGSGTPQGILYALAGSETPRSNKDLADVMGCTEETIARNIPALRDEGLVQSDRTWRTIFNRITPKGREILETGTRAFGTESAEQSPDFAASIPVSRKQAG